MQPLPKSISALLLICAASIAFAADNDKQVATVNGEPIMTSELIIYANIKNPKADLNSPQTRQQLIQAYLGRELLYQEALAQKLDKSERVQMALDNQRREIVSQALVAKILKENPVTEAQARKFYEQQSAASKAAEYKTRHILTTSEQKAKEAIERLNSGENFDKVARNFSTDSSASRGGEIGWINPARMPQNFAAALRDTAVGEYTKAPVQTKFGWHVIQVEASRPLSMPDFVQVRDQLMQLLAEQRVSEYVAELQKKADIKINQ